MVDGDAAQLHGGEHRHAAASRSRRAARRELSEQRAQHDGREAQRVPRVLRRTGVDALFGDELVRVGLRHASRRGRRRRDRRATSPAGSGARSQPATRVSSTSPSNARPERRERLQLRLGVGHDLGRVAREPRLERRVVGAIGLPGQAHRLVERRDAGADDPAVEHVEAQAEAGRLRRDGALEPGRQLLVEERARRRRGRASATWRCGARSPARSRRRRCRSPRRCELGHALEQGAELEPLEDRAHGRRGRSAWRSSSSSSTSSSTSATRRLSRRLRTAFSRSSRRFWPTTPLISSACVEDAVEVAVEAEPLDGGLLADLRDAGEVVARLADEGGDVGVLLGPDAVALDDRVGVVALELRDALRVGVEQGDVVVRRAGWCRGRPRRAARGSPRPRRGWRGSRGCRRPRSPPSRWCGCPWPAGRPAAAAPAP